MQRHPGDLGMTANLFKSALHNAGVLAVGLALEYLGTLVDALAGFPAISFP